MPAKVRLEMRRLVVDLAAAGQVAAVDAALAEVQRRGGSEPVRFLAVGAVARAAARVAPVRPRAGGHARRARPRPGAGSNESGQSPGGGRRRWKEPRRQDGLVAVGGRHEGRSDERRPVERFQRGRIFAGGAGVVAGCEAVEDRVRAGVVIVLFLDPTGSRGSVSTTPPRSHV